MPPTLLDIRTSPGGCGQRRISSRSAETGCDTPAAHHTQTGARRSNCSSLPASTQPPVHRRPPTACSPSSQQPVAVGRPPSSFNAGGPVRPAWRHDGQFSRPAIARSRPPPQALLGAPRGHISTASRVQASPCTRPRRSPIRRLSHIAALTRPPLISVPCHRPTGRAIRRRRPRHLAPNRRLNSSTLCRSLPSAAWAAQSPAAKPANADDVS